jgi:hypothetical protein
MIRRLNVRLVLISGVFLAASLSQTKNCHAQAPPPVNVTYQQSAPSGGWVTETMIATGPSVTASLKVFAYEVTGTSPAYTYTPYGTPVDLLPVYTTNSMGITMWNGTFKGSGTLPSGTGKKFVLRTMQLSGGAWYQVATSTHFTP